MKNIYLINGILFVSYSFFAILATLQSINAINAIIIWSLYLFLAILHLVTLLIICLILFLKKKDRIKVKAILISTAVILIVGTIIIFILPKITASKYPRMPDASDIFPHIESVYPSIASVGDTLTIKGYNLNSSEDGVISSSHTFVKLSDDSGNFGVLWSGNPAINEKTMINQIKVVIPAKVGSLQILPGKYTLIIDVDGRGTSNSETLNIFVETL